MGYNDEAGNPHFVTVGIDQEKDFEVADAFFFTFDGEDIPVGSVRNDAFEVDQCCLGRSNACLRACPIF